MILPNCVSPKQCLYYKGSILIRVLKSYGSLHVTKLYEVAKKEEETSYSLFLISLDWLYLAGIVTESDGVIKLCT